MAALDEYFESIAEYVRESKMEHGQVRKFYISHNSEYLKTFPGENYDPQPGSNIVLKSNTFLELGRPSIGSYAMSLYTHNMDALTDGEIILIGPDVGEFQSPELPFGQVIMVAGKELGNDDYYRLLKYINKSNLIKGYMVKSTSDNIWSRISHQAAKSGFNFILLGAALMRQIKIELPKVMAVSILFVTSDKRDVLRLRTIGKGIREIQQKVKEKFWEDRGVNLVECSLDGHCGLCKNKKVCEAINKISLEYQ